MGKERSHRLSPGTQGSSPAGERFLQLFLPAAFLPSPDKAARVAMETGWSSHRRLTALISYGVKMQAAGVTQA